MTVLEERLVQTIRTNGPLSVADYMAACLNDHEIGYYTTRDPFGRNGDFVTSPEISQIFGELIGIWVIGVWQTLGKPNNIILCEMGPGRGTLMADLLRTANCVARNFVHSVHIAMVETSPRLTAIQKEKLKNVALHIQWYDRIEKIATGVPLILIANELFDALPIRQFVKIGDHFIERMVTFKETVNGGQLCFTVGLFSINPSFLPPHHMEMPEGTIFEIAPTRTTLMQRIVERLKADRGAALLIDYGHLEAGFGDTLQAVSRHKPQNVFEKPGEVDLTSHVNFAALANVARNFACRTAMMTQGNFLMKMGLFERAQQLTNGKIKSIQEQIRNDIERLAAPKQMGTLFKILCVSDKKSCIFPFEQSTE